MEAAGPTMTTEDLTAGFHTRRRLQERDWKVMSDIGACVVTNANLLNEVITKVNTFEVSMSLTGENLDRVAGDTRFGLTKMGQSACR